MTLNYLSLYGKTFQSKIIVCLLTDVKFLAQIFDILESKDFESDANQLIIERIREYFTLYKKCPLYDTFDKLISEQSNESLKFAIKEQLNESARLADSDDLQFVKDQFSDFCINQNVKNAVLKSVEYIKDGNYDAIKTSIDKALKSGKSKDIGHVYETQVENRITLNPRKRLIPTEWIVINDIIDGGLGEGDLGILVGGAGTGKSWILTSLGYHALTIGKNVIHITLELNENYTAKRYDSKLTGIPSEELKYNLDLVKEKIASTFTGKLIVKYYPTKSVSVSTIKAFVDLIKQNHFIPDLLIVDYADCLKSDGYHQEGGSYAEMGSIYEALRGLAGECEIPVWTASQSNRGSMEEEIVTGQHVAESFKKVMIGDFVVSISRRAADKLNNVARWYVIKNRYGKDGLTFPSYLDASIGKINIERQDSFEGAKIKNTMKSNDVIMKELAKKRKKEIDMSGFTDDNKFVEKPKESNDIKPEESNDDKI